MSDALFLQKKIYAFGKVSLSQNLFIVVEKQLRFGQSSIFEITNSFCAITRNAVNSIHIPPALDVPLVIF